MPPEKQGGNVRIGCLLNDGSLCNLTVLQRLSEKFMQIVIISRSIKKTTEKTVYPISLFYNNVSNI